MSDNQSANLPPNWGTTGYGYIYDTGNGNAVLCMYSSTAREFLGRDSRYKAALPAGQTAGPKIIIDSYMSVL